MPALTRLATTAAILAVCGTLAAQSRPSPNPTVPELLAASGTYVADYERQFSAVVSQERYDQTNMAIGQRIPQRRTLLSDVMLISAGLAGWVSLRDVYEVNGLPVRDHTDRLMKLMTDSGADGFAQAVRLAQESARFNLGDVTRTINVPAIALLFLRRENQTRSAFTFEGMKTVDRLRVAQLAFKEQSRPRIVRSADDAAAEGKFWLEPASGRVVQTEFAFKSAGNSAKITVHYANQPKLGLWLPVTMDEQMTTPRGAVTGRADYKNFRKFDVDVSTIIK